MYKFTFFLLSVFLSSTSIAQNDAMGDYLSEQEITRRQKLTLESQERQAKLSLKISENNLKAAKIRKLSEEKYEDLEERYEDLKADIEKLAGKLEGHQKLFSEADKSDQASLSSHEKLHDNYSDLKQSLNDLKSSLANLKGQVEAKPESSTQYATREYVYTVVGAVGVFLSTIFGAFGAYFLKLKGRTDD